MERVSTTLCDLESKEDREREEAIRPAPPYRIAAEKTLRLLGISASEDQLDRVGMALRCGLCMGAADLPDPSPPHGMSGWWAAALSQI
jgi:hypothetical protein